MTFPNPPYYAVIFSNQLTTDVSDYSQVADRMVELAQEQDGFLGIDSARGADGFGITVSYWRDEAAIAAWKAQGEHTLAQDMGRERFYQTFETRVAKVERAYRFEKA